MTRKMGYIQVDGLFDQNGNPVTLPLPSSPVVLDYTLAVPATTMLFSSLDVNAWGVMRVVFGVSLAAGGDISMYYNGDVTAGNYRNRGWTAREATLSVKNASDAIIVGAAETGQAAQGEIIFMRNVGTRCGFIYKTRISNPGPQWASHGGAIGPNAAPANITSITFSATQNFQANSWVQIYRGII